MNPKILTKDTHQFSWSTPYPRNPKKTRGQANDWAKRSRSVASRDNQGNKETFKVGGVDLSTDWEQGSGFSKPKQYFPCRQICESGQKDTDGLGPSLPESYWAPECRPPVISGWWVVAEYRRGETLREVQPRAGRRVGSLNYGCSESVQLYGYGSGSELTVSTDWRL